VDDPRRLPGPDETVEESRSAVTVPEAPPPLPRTLIHPPPFEHAVSVDGFVLGPEPGPLLPPHLALATHAWSPATADARLSGLGWTEALTLDSGLLAPRWAISGRWAPPALSARPAPVGVAGTAVTGGPEGMAVSAPRGAWRASGLLGGPLVQGRLGAVLSLEGSGLGLPAVEPGLAAGGRSRQTLALTTTWRPTEADRLGLLLLAGRRTESPDCFRCTDAAARVDRTLAVLAGVSWMHAFGATTLDLRFSVEHRLESTAASGSPSGPSGPSHLDLSTWVTDGAPGALGPDQVASAAEGSHTRVLAAAGLSSMLGKQRLSGGVEARLEVGRTELTVPEQVRFVDRGGPCTDAETGGCAFRVGVDPTQVDARGWTLGTYLEDALQLGDVMLRGGVRLDLTQADAGEQSTGARLGLGPRLAMAWNVAGEGRHWVLLHAGRSHDAALAGVVVRTVTPVQRVAEWSNGEFDPCTAPGPSCVRLGGRATLAPGGLPRADEVGIGWQGRLGRGLEGGLDALWRHTVDLWAEQETALFTDERGRWSSIDGLWQSRRTASADARAWRQMLGLGIWARAWAGPARVSAVWSVARVWGTAARPFDPWLVDARTAGLATGPLPEDRRHRATVVLSFFLHPALEVGARLRYASGAPLWETYAVPDSAGLLTVLATRGTGVLGGGAVALRDPDVLAADAWLRVRLGALLPGGARASTSRSRRRRLQAGTRPCTCRQARADWGPCSPENRRSRWCSGFGRANRSRRGKAAGNSPPGEAWVG
jgi:hypothetical protein